MAAPDYGYGPYGAEDAFAEGGGAMARIVNGIGAAVSLALILGLAVWGYQLLRRDVTGVPVIQALEGPMRVQPDDPGGTRADHQGLAVNRIAALGEAAPPPDEIVLAPRSADLEAEDLALGVLMPAAAGEPAPPRPEALEAAIIAAVAEEVVGIEAGAEIVPAALETLSAEVPGLVRSIRPRPREALPAAAPSAEAPEAEAAAAPLPLADGEADPAAIAPGTRLVQLGAYESRDEARAAWGELQASFGPLMDGKRRVVEEVAMGSATIYRLRAMGFDDMAEANRFCAPFLIEELQCIPVAQR
jgi:cell division septation protein DedD